MTQPPGWPRDLAAPNSHEFADQVTGWLLDRCPGSWRQHEVLRNHPVALAQLVADHLAATLVGLRDSYRSARRLLGEHLAAPEVDQVLVAIEAEGAQTAETARQVGLVAEALAGKQWRPRL